MSAHPLKSAAAPARLNTLPGSIKRALNREDFRADVKADVSGLLDAAGFYLDRKGDFGDVYISLDHPDVVLTVNTIGCRNDVCGSDRISIVRNGEQLTRYAADKFCRKIGLPGSETWKW